MISVQSEAKTCGDISFKDNSGEIVMCTIEEAASVSEVHPKEVTSSNLQARPWIRFWARLFDNWMFGLVVGIALAVFAPTSLKSIVFGNEIWFGIACLFAWVLIEAILISTIGTTPGKWLFKIELTPAVGATITFPKALARSISVWWRGLGAGFPLVSLFTLLHAHGRLTKCGVTSWDREEGFKVLYGSIGIARGVIASALIGALLLLSSWPQQSASSQLTFDEVASQLDEKQQSALAVSSIQDRATQLREASMSDERLPITRSWITPKARGEFGEFERIMTEFFDQISALQNAYSLELEAIGLGSLLDAPRLQNDRTLAESRFIVSRSKAIIDKYEREFIALVDRWIMGIQVPSISEADRTEILAGFIKKVKGQWQLERDVVEQFENILQILAATDWMVEDGQILFASDGDRERILSHITAIQRIAQQQEASRKNAFAEADQTFEVLKGSLGR